MSNVDRRRFLLATTATAIGSAAGCTSGADGDRIDPWERVREDAAFSTYTDGRTLEDGALLVGTLRGNGQDGYEPSAGLATKLTPGGDVGWERRYPSPDQVETIEAEVVGPIPEDGFAFSLPAGDGHLLVGWTYYDNTAVYVGRLVRVDADGEVSWDRSFTDLEDASAYSYLADGVVTDDGYLLCGIESPGISLGGAGWLVSVAPDGSPNWYERFPATERDLAETIRQDVFTGIVPVDGGYVLSGHYEPETGDERAWVVGIDDAGSLRWRDDFALETAGPTRATDVAVSEGGADYDVLVVGAAGPRFDARANSREAIDLEGDGFVAAYTADGERRWLQVRDGTPMSCLGRSSRGLVAGGADGGRAWVGTADHTDFVADDASVVTSLARTRSGELVAAGVRLDADRARAWSRLIAEVADDLEDDGPEDDGTADDETDEPKDDAGDDGNGDGSKDEGSTDDDTGDEGSTDDGPKDEDPKDEPSADPDEWTFDFLDCETVRVTGDVADVLLNVIWWEGPDEDLVGTISEPVGGVDGERTIGATAEFGEFAFGPVLTSVEGFAEGTPVVPGGGDVRVENPQGEACQEAILETFDGEDESSTESTADGNESATD